MLAVRRGQRARQEILRRLRDGAAGAGFWVPGVRSNTQHPAPDTHPGERRQLTVLFCDLVGSTALSQQLDAEEWRDVVGQYQQAARAAVERWGGHVAKELGDGLLVYFGWPDAREDDPERAIRAGLAIIEQVSRVGSRVSGPQHPAPSTSLSVRVGMHTGPVVIADGGEVFSETANVAARVQGAADPDTVVVTAATQRLVPGILVAAQHFVDTEWHNVVYGLGEDCRPRGGLVRTTGRRNPFRSRRRHCAAVLALLLAARGAGAAPVITTVAGNGNAGDDGDGGLAIEAAINGPSDIAVDGSGNVYLDTGGADYRVRRVDAATGIISTYAGDGEEGSSGDGGLANESSVEPYALAVDSGGNLFLSDLEDDQRVRRVDAATGILTTVAGGGANSPGDGGSALASSIGDILGLDVDAAGNLYLTDVYPYQSVRRVDALTGIISTIAGGGTGPLCGAGVLATTARLDVPYDAAVDPAGNLFIAGNYCFRVYRVDALTGLMTILAGTGVSGSAGDGGLATAAQLSLPTGVAVDPLGNVFISDQANGRVRRVDVGTGIITTVAGGGANDPGDGGPPTTASLGRLTKIAVTDGGATFYVGDFDGRRVRRVSNCGNGTVEPPEQCDTGTANGVPGSCCTFNCRTWDNDGDAACDDGPDLCMNAGGARTLLDASLKVRTNAVRFTGTFHPPAGVPFDPIARGAQVKLLNGSSEPVLDVALPAGAYAGTGTKGWRLISSGKTWKFTDSTGAPGARARMLVKRKSAAEVVLKIIVRNVSVAVATDLPISLTAVFGDQVQSAGGQCGEVSFPAATCSVGAAGSLKCQG